MRKSSQIEATTAETKTKNQIKKMNITNYKTGEYIGTSTSIDVEAYEKMLAADNTGTGGCASG